ncbi:YlaH-like protein [Paenibacillaceae bacterium GAS479]|nr:YlaH-like protein [Paenibacillaceae bacterium GAS479]
MQDWLSDHPLVTYILILASVIYIFNKVFRAQQRLPLLKEILVYFVMAFGSGVLLVLQIDKLPILQCMAVAIAMMFLLRIRQFNDRRLAKRQQQGDTSKG